MNFSQKTFFISGGSRGIGRAIALKLAQRGANIAIAAKTATARSDLDGTIFSVAGEIEKAGGKALALQCDIREEEQVEEAIAKTVSKFGGLDGLVNNASAISVTGTLNTKMKTYDLMNEVNARGTFLCSQKALPHLLKSSHPHILNLSPPLNLHPKWFKNNTAYTIAKYGMSMCVLGMAEEFKDRGVGVNALWPLTTIATAAIENNFGEKYMKMSRSPDIVADAAIAVLSRNPKSCTGNFFIDEEVLKEEGITDFGIYSYEAGSEVFFADGFLPDEVLARTSTKLINIYDG